MPRGNRAFAQTEWPEAQQRRDLESGEARRVAGCVEWIRSDELVRRIKSGAMMRSRVNPHSPIGYKGVLVDADEGRAEKVDR